MITNTAGTTVVLNQNTTYSSVTGLWTLVSPHALFDSGLLNFGNPLVGKMIKSSSVSLLPSGSADSSIYYIFKVGNTIGLAATLEDASNNVPVKFYTSGELFSFVQAGNTYNLYAISSCCEPDYFETQYPVDSTWSATLDNGTYSGLSRFPIPCFLPKKISFIWYNIGEIDLYLIYYSANPTSNYTQSYRPFLIYGNGHDPKYSLQNTHRFQANVHFYHDKNLDQLVIRFTISTFIIINGNNIITQHGYEAIRNLTYDANNNVNNNIFETIPTFNRLYPNFGPSPATINLTPTDNYEAELLPASITLTKINEPITVNQVFFEPTTLRRSAVNPDRGWTVNDYTNELPETIVLNKVSFSNYESENFITSVNVTNKIKLKLANSGLTPYVSSPFHNFFGYLFFVHREESFFTGYYLPGFCTWKFEPLSEDFYAIRYTMPTQVSYGPVQFRLFKMAGVLNETIFAPESSTIYTDVFYMIQDPNA